MTLRTFLEDIIYEAADEVVKAENEVEAMVKSVVENFSEGSRPLPNGC